MNMWIFVAGIVVGLIPLGIATWLWRKRKTQFIGDRDAQATNFESMLAMKDAEMIQHREQTRRESASRERQYKENLEGLRAWVARGMHWEEGSRQQLVEACESLGVDGFVATNVCFMVQHATTPYIHQIDHLVVADNMLFIVEAKHWKGTIFHRTRYESDKDPFFLDVLPMLNDVAPQDRYVVKIDDEGKMLWFPNGNAPEPVKQVQQQSINFKKYLTKHLRRDPGNTLNCVLYSHPDSTLQGGARSFGKYTWVTQKRELTTVLDVMQQHRGRMNAPSVPVAALHELVWSLGADICGVGKYAQQWQSPIPLGHQRQESNER